MTDSLGRHVLLSVTLISTHITGRTFMEAERINSIGNALDDLRTRTEDLRRYL